MSSDDQTDGRARDNHAPFDARTYFAAQRTLLAWIRTGLALMGFGFVVARFGLFLRELASARITAPVKHTTLSLWAGTALVVLGVLVNAVAAVQHHHILRQIARGQEPHPERFPVGVVLSALLTIIGIAMAIYLVAMG